MAIVLNGTTGITAPDIDVTAQSTDIVTTGDVSAVDGTFSGGVYLGGTGSANKLDDYEEGTFTPVLRGSTTNPTVSYAQQSGYYTRIGNLVFVAVKLQTSSQSGGAGNFEVKGFPYNIINDGNFRSSNQPSFLRGITHYGSYIGAHPLVNDNGVIWYRQANSTDFDLQIDYGDVNSVMALHFSYMYITDE